MEMALQRGATPRLGSHGSDAGQWRIGLERKGGRWLAAVLLEVRWQDERSTRAADGGISDDCDGKGI